LGVRPEALQIAAEGEIAGQALVIERLGSLTLLHVRTADDTLVVQTDGENTTRLHAPLRLSINAAACHVFTADGMALPRLAPHHLTDAA
jgi:multiple sugar transport system ATP-binding protein